MIKLNIHNITLLVPASMQRKMNPFRAFAPHSLTFRFNIILSRTPRSSCTKVQGSYVGLPGAPNLPVTLIPPPKLRYTTKAFRQTGKRVEIIVCSAMNLHGMKLNNIFTLPYKDDLLQFRTSE